MIIRDYCKTDEQGWLSCRLNSFFDSSYFNDIKREKEKYEKPSVCLVAEEEGQVIGILDMELDSEDLSCAKDERGAIVWHLGVLPQYRKQGVARALWEATKQRMLEEGIHYCEIWTQEDEAANKFYQSVGFEIEDSQTWLRCYVQGRACKELLKQPFLEKIYGPEELIFDVPVVMKEEMEKICYRIDEVRLYCGRF